MAEQQQRPQQSRLIKPKTRRGRRILLARAPKAVEDAKRALLLYGSTTSAVVKNVLIDLHKMKGLEVQKFTRKNRDIRPFEAGGETSLQFYATKSSCGLFALASHTKKRPHNLTLGRLYDGQLYDVLELAVDRFEPINAFGSAAKTAQAGNKPCILFVGEKFESVPALQQSKSMLLDFFRGQQVESLNLSGLDRVMVAVALDDTRIMLRQYAIRMKKSGGSVPRVALQEMGPRLNFTLRRSRPPAPELQKEACKQPKMGKKKVKNVGSDSIDGKVGRIYMPKQKVDELALGKMKGLRRERRDKKRDSSDARKAVNLTVVFCRRQGQRGQEEEETARGHVDSASGRRRRVLAVDPTGGGGRPVRLVDERLSAAGAAPPSTSRS